MRTSADELRNGSVDLVIVGAALLVVGFVMPLHVMWVVATLAFAAGGVLRASASLVRAADAQAPVRRVI